jgi:hypothetical protein
MSLVTHMSMLEEKHGKLDQMISDEAVRPLPDFSVIQTLKKQKLLLKEELQRVRDLAGIQHDAA